ncbi:DUF1317 family protein [Methylobacter sp.]
MITAIWSATAIGWIIPSGKIMKNPAKPTACG